MFPTFNKFQKLLICVAAGALLTLVVLSGVWASLQVSKRQFEADAQNVVAVLRSGMSVVDGVATSLEAAHNSATGYQQLNLHLGKVLSNYNFVSGIGRFERIPESDFEAFEAFSTDGSSGIWQFKGEGSAALVSAGSTNKGEYYPLALVKSRPGSGKHTDLTGFDLGSFNPIREIINNPSSIGRTIVMTLPAAWKRPGHLIALRTSAQGDALNGGYLLELDIEEIASSGGVQLSDLALSLSSFTAQGEFESSATSTPIYRSVSRSEDNSALLSNFQKNHWVSSFEVGDLTMVLELSRVTGISSKLASGLLLVAAILLFMFLSIVHLVGKRRTAQKLQKIESEKLYRARHRAAVTLASIGDGVITTDAQDNIIYANDAAETLLGASSEAMQGRSADKVIVFNKNRAADTISGDGELALLSADGTVVYVNKKVSDLRDSDGEFLGHVIVLRDISIERSLTMALQYKVNHDSLTGLANRFNFEAQLDILFENPRPGGNGYAVCFIDLDRFKEVNDTCGHGAGDELLVLIGKAFKDNVRDIDLVARLGGDEFAIILRDCAQPDALRVAERIKEFFQSFYFEYDEHVFPVRCSIGVVHFDPVKATRDKVLKLADAACYNAKNAGRNVIREGAIGVDAQDLKAESSVLWLPRIKDALANEKFTLHVQSIASMLDGSIATHEILLRIIDEDNSLIYPTSFMKTAVRYGLALNIDRWVFSRALVKIKELPDRYASDKFTINLSTQSVGSKEFLAFAAEHIALSGIDASRLCFDVSENDVLKNPVVVAEFCRDLQAMGCEVVLDDFGAAMTSFSTLKMLPLNALKIDGSLVANLNSASMADASGDGNADYALVKSIVSFASSMGLSTIVEQVEDVACLAVLKSVPLDYVQGLAVSEPVSFDDFMLEPDSGQKQQAA